MNRLNKQIVENYKQYPERILQFGEGNFLRGFVDWMIHKMNQEADFNSGVVVIQPLDNGLVHKLNEQDGLYTLYLNGIKNGELISEHTVNNCMTRGINTYTDYDDFLKTAENPDLRLILSNTTEAGIAFNEKDRLEDRPQSSFPGKLTAFLYHRYKAFNGDVKKGFVIIPCELIDQNGDQLKEVILKLIELWGLEIAFKNWILEANTFCNSLVDRIVPGYPKERIEEIQEELGYEDHMVVEGEPFHLWVIEGPQWVKEEFPAHKAGLNVLVVDDMTAYRTRKVRILNGAHTTMVPVAYLYGLETVKETVEHEVVGKYVKDAIFQEIIPTLDLPADELEGFAHAVLDRFINPYIKHNLMSIALNSMSKFETRVLPSILEYKNRKGKLPEKLVFSLASLIAFYRGERNGASIALADNPEILNQSATLWKEYDGSIEGINRIVADILENEAVWKMNLNEVAGLRDAVAKYLTVIEAKGMVKAIEEVL